LLIMRFSHAGHPSTTHSLLHRKASLTGHECTGDSGI
jgi:hypothetical protein